MRPRLLLVPALAAASALVASTLPAARADEAPRRLTLTQAVDAALSDNPELELASRSVGVADEKIKSAKALRLPRLGVEANVLLWNDNSEFSFSIPGAPPTPPTEVRAQVTSTVTVTVAQPLSGLAVIGRYIAIEENGRKAAVAELDGARLDVAAQAAELYLRAMQARAFAEIAERSVTQLDAQKQRAQALVDAGVLGKVDLMRIDSARAQVVAQALTARDGAAAAIDALVMLLGLPGGVAIEPVDDLPAALPPPPWDEATALGLAAERRPELRTAEARADQAAGAIDVKRADYYPNVNAVATYQNTQGQGAFGEPNTFFVGVVLKWDLWDWGRRGAEVAAARGQAAQARQAATRVKDRVALDVRGRVRTARTAHEKIAVAASGLATAEEAYRILSVRYQNGDATTLDVLDAEADVARARLAAVTARYDYAIALVQLARAVGERPLAALAPAPGGAASAPAAAPAAAPAPTTPSTKDPR